MFYEVLVIFYLREKKVFSFHSRSGGLTPPPPNNSCPTSFIKTNVIPIKGVKMSKFILLLFIFLLQKLDVGQQVLKYLLNQLSANIKSKKITFITEVKLQKKN